MTNTSKHTVTGLAFAAALFLGQTGLYASPSLYFFDTATSQSVTVLDGGVGDLNSDLGSITWNGQVGNWHISFSSGLFDSSAGQSTLDLASGILSSSSADSLIIRFSENGFGPGNASVVTGIGGNSIGTIQYRAFVDPANAMVTSSVPGTALNLVGPATVGGSPFSQAGSANINLASAYSLTQEAIITHSAAGRTSFDFSVNVSPVPEPSSLSLLAMAALGGAAWSRRRVARN